MKQLILFCLLLIAGSMLSGQSSSTALLAEKKLTDAGASVERPAAGLQILNLPEALSRDIPSFVSDYGPALGLGALDDLHPLQSIPGADGRNYLHFGRRHQGIPVFGGDFRVQLHPSGAPRRIVGPLISAEQFPVSTPGTTLPSSTLQQLAKTRLTSIYPQIQHWSVTDLGLSWATPDPWAEAADQTYRLTQVFQLREPAGFRAEQVYLDAQNGKIVFRHQLHCELNRKVYNGSTQAGNLIWREGFAFPGGLDAEGRELVLATEEAYNLFYRSFGRFGYDGNDGEMIGVINAALNNCPNANAWGNTVNHCSGVVSDDVVAHEWTHNYIAQLSGLIYRFESGAINEAYADIFGEIVDLLNQRGTDTDDQQLRADCTDDNVRWKLGEDVTGFGGHLRDMWQPECKNDPSARNSSDYLCANAETDNGGVHTNSGIVNRTFSLLTDGGTLNGITVQGIGLTKAAHIFHHANANYLTPVTDFEALGMLLKLAAGDLIGQNLPVLTLEALPAMASGEQISVNDSLQVALAAQATQLQGVGLCFQAPTLEQSPPSPCQDAAVATENILFREDWENGLGEWTTLESPVNPATWDAKPWTMTNLLPDGRPGTAAFAPNAFVGDCNTDLDNGIVSLTSPDINLPGTEDNFTLRFTHYYSIEADYDGGILFLSVNGAPFSPVPESAFLYNGYDGELERPGLNDNPLAGLPAFHGADQNSTTGTWGESLVDLLAAGASPGDDIRLRWSLGQDGCNGWLGWYVDDLSVSSCSAGALPVTYLGFTAQPAKDHVLLSWKTAAETNNQGFTVERDAGDGFRDIGFVVAGGNQYRFEDYAVRSNQQYLYRLRQRDYDGTESLSEVISARLRVGSAIVVYPNPASDRLIIEGNTLGEEIVLFDANGRRVRGVQGTLERAVLELNNLPSGIYWIRSGGELRRVVVRQR